MRMQRDIDCCTECTVHSYIQFRTSCRWEGEVTGGGEGGGGTNF